jgi:succinoglycan biosynthesis protein ExoM
VTSVDVCVCTFRRSSLAETLKSIARQQLRELRMRVIVADNDDHSERREEILSLGRDLGLELEYVHAPARNISIARNACLAASRGDWIAFIDDDEIATPTWLSELLRASGDRDVIFGVSRAIYDVDAPEWIRKGDFHSAMLRPRDPPWNGYSGNVLIRRRFVSRGLMFEADLGQTGGEDTVFFFEAMRAGARFGYAPTSIVQEPTGFPRTTLKWMLLRRFRAGQTHHSLLLRQGRSASGVPLAACKAVWSAAAAAAFAPWQERAARHALRSAFHAGVVAAGVGVRTYREYRRARPEPIILRSLQ